METISLEYSMGCVVNLDNSNVADYVFEWYQKLDRSSLKQGCISFLKKVIEDNKKFYKVCLEFATKDN